MAGGYGMGSFGSWPFGTTSIVQAPATQSSISSSRKINSVTRRYVINDEGGFDAFDDVAQRVYLLIAFADQQQPIITPANDAARIARIRAALNILTRGPTPTIRNLRVTIGDSGAGQLLPLVTYDRVLVNTLTTLPARAS